MKKKIEELNRKIKTVCANERLDSFDNSNVDNSCLAQKGLHLNHRGNVALKKKIF